MRDYEGALYGNAAGTVSADTPPKPSFLRRTGRDVPHQYVGVRNISALGYSYPELHPTHAAPDGQGGVYATPRHARAAVCVRQVQAGV